MTDGTAFRVTVASPYGDPVTTAGGLCPPWRFTCRDGQCVASSSVCNGRVDCGDGSDESTDHAHCTSGSLVNYEGSIGVATGVVALAFVLALGIYCYKYGKPNDETTLGADVAVSGETTVYATAYHNGAFSAHPESMGRHARRQISLDAHVPARITPAISYNMSELNGCPPSYDSIFGTDRQRSRLADRLINDPISVTEPDVSGDAEDIYPLWNTVFVSGDVANSSSQAEYAVDVNGEETLSYSPSDIDAGSGHYVMMYDPVVAEHGSHSRNSDSTIISQVTQNDSNPNDSSFRSHHIPEHRSPIDSQETLPRVSPDVPHVRRQRDVPIDINSGGSATQTIAPTDGVTPTASNQQTREIFNHHMCGLDLTDTKHCGVWHETPLLLALENARRNAFQFLDHDIASLDSMGSESPHICCSDLDYATAFTGDDRTSFTCVECSATYL